MVAKALEYAAHNAVASGMYFNTGLIAVGLGCIADCVGVDGSVVKLYAVSDTLHILFSYVLVGPHMIYLFLDIFGVGEFGGQVAVVGEQEHSGSVAVEASTG